MLVEMDFPRQGKVEAVIVGEPVLVFVAHMHVRSLRAVKEREGVEPSGAVYGAPVE